MQLAFFVVGVGLQIVASLLRPTQHAPKSPEDKLTDSAFGTPLERGWGTTNHTGVLIWKGPRHEEEHEQGGKGGGGATAWSYSQSFAMAFCAGPRAKVLRIWKNKTKLLYDVTGDNTGKTHNVSISFHSGNETQDPDPTIESVEGAGNVPAWRGLCYIVFKNMDTTEDGGRIPDIMAEITSSPGTGDPIEDKIPLSDISADLTELYDFRPDKSHEIVYARSNHGFTKINSDTDKEIYSGYPYASSFIQDWDVDETGHIWVIDWETEALGPSGEARLLRLVSDTMSPQPALTLSSPFVTIAGANKQWEKLCSIGNDSALLAVSGIRGPDYPTNANSHCCLAEYHYAWDELTQQPTLTEVWRQYIEGSDLVGLERRFAAAKTSTEIYAALNNPALLVSINGGVATTEPWTGRTTTNLLYVAANNELVVFDDDHAIRFWKLSDSSWRILTLSNQGRHLLSPWPNSDAIWCQEDQAIMGYALHQVDIVQRTTSLPLEYLGKRVDCFEENSQAFYAPSTSCTTDCITKYLLREDGGARVNVSDIVKSICKSSGIVNVDVSTIDDTVIGFKSPGNVAPRADLECLAKAFLLEKVEQGPVLCIQKRYPTDPKAVIEIPWDDLGAHEPGQEPPARLKHTIQDELEYPKEVIVQSLEQTKMYERGGERAFRSSTQSRRSETFDLTQLVLTESERREIAQAILVNRWSERHVYELTTSRKYSTLYPGSLIRVRPPGEDHTILIRKVDTGSPGLVKIEGVQSVYQPPLVIDPSWQLVMEDDSWSHAVFNGQLYFGMASTYNSRIVRSTTGAPDDWSTVLNVGRTTVYNLRSINGRLYSTHERYLETIHIYNSPDGQTWAGPGTFYEGLYANNIVGVGDMLFLASQGRNYCWSSGDHGINWTYQGTIVEGETYQGTQIWLFNGFLYAICNTDKNVYMSADGTTWMIAASIDADGMDACFAIHPLEDVVFLTLRNNTSGASAIYRSTDMENWSQVFLAVSGYAMNYAIDRTPTGQYYMAWYDETSSNNARVYSSPDGISWSLFDRVPLLDGYDFVYPKIAAVFNGYLYVGCKASDTYGFIQRRRIKW